MTMTEQMNAGVNRWIEECKGRGDGASILRKRAAWLEGLITKQGQGRKVPELEGVKVWDSQNAYERLRRAADEMESKHD
jgi:hypothetical protein